MLDYQKFLRVIFLVVLIDKIDDDFYHGILLFGAAFGYHQGEGNESIVSYALGAILIVEDAVAIPILIVDGVDDFEFEVFGVVFVRHVAGDDALEEVFVDASGCYVVDDHALHEAVSVPVVAVMDEEPDTDCQGDTFIGVLEIMSGA